MGKEILNRFCAISAKGTNSCDFLFASLCTSPFLKKRSALKGLRFDFLLASLKDI